MKNGDLTSEEIQRAQERLAEDLNTLNKLAKNKILYYKIFCLIKSATTKCCYQEDTEEGCFLILSNFNTNTRQYTFYFTYT